MNVGIYWQLSTYPSYKTNKCPSLAIVYILLANSYHHIVDTKLFFVCHSVSDDIRFVPPPDFKNLDNKETLNSLS